MQQKVIPHKAEEFRESECEMCVDDVRDEREDDEREVKEDERNRGKGDAWIEDERNAGGDEEAAHVSSRNTWDRRKDGEMLEERMKEGRVGVRF
ncbi:hypothetical protein Baya_8578 [Bagarius yarrelli]|uniref:Uncharacterized protein n=1 Tax=Bagarius yarrelli TaxID=175774 RepID=A0A556U4C7_BAGYA|nr:hypothetical protein Baya_8578 [Bagarius yarrelli]